MHLAERDRVPIDERTPGSTEEGPALRDASVAAQRAADDEAQAAEARERFRIHPLPEIDADDEVGAQLAAGERVHTLRRHAILRDPGGATFGYGGMLYLTSNRLIHLGQVVVSVRLTDILETSLAGERLLLTLRQSEGLTLDVDRPRLLRAEMAEALRRLRG